MQFIQLTQILQRAQGGAASALTRDAISLVGAYWERVETTVIGLIGVFDEDGGPNQVPESITTNGSAVGWARQGFLHGGGSFDFVVKDHEGRNWFLYVDMHLELKMMSEAYVNSRKKENFEEDARHSLKVGLDVEGSYFGAGAIEGGARILFMIWEGGDKHTQVYKYNMRTLKIDYSETVIGKFMGAKKIISIDDKRFITFDEGRLIGYLDLEKETFEHKAHGDFMDGVKLRDGRLLFVVNRKYHVSAMESLRVVLCSPDDIVLQTVVNVTDIKVLNAHVAMMDDGRVFIFGGELEFPSSSTKVIPNRMTFVFDPATNTVARSADLFHGIRRCIVYAPERPLYVRPTLTGREEYCRECGSRHCTMRCRGCGVPYYCSEGCKEKHWRAHRETCLQ